MTSILGVLQYLLRVSGLRRTQKKSPPVIPGRLVDVLLWIHRHCDIPERRKMEEALGWPPFGTRKLPPPTVDLWLLKQSFKRPLDVYFPLQLVIPIGDGPRRYIYTVWRRTGIWWLRTPKPAWWRRRHSNTRRRPRWILVTTRPASSYCDVDSLCTDDLSIPGDPFLHGRTQLYRSCITCPNVNGLIRLKEHAVDRSGLPIYTYFHPPTFPWPPDWGLYRLL